MSHPLNAYARYVEHALDQDEALERPTYTWCLKQVQAHMGAVAETIPGGLTGKARRAAVSEALVTAIKPTARRVRQ
jgi:hypothetical protein